MGKDIALLLSEKKLAVDREDFERAGVLLAEVDKRKEILKGKLRSLGYELTPIGLKTIPKTTGHPISTSSSALPTVPLPQTLPKTVENPLRSLDNLHKPLSPPIKESIHPDKLSDAELQEYAMPIKVFGLDAVSCILSPFFNLRQRGIETVQDLILSGTKLPCDPPTVAKSVFKLLLFLECDTRERSYMLICTLFQNAIGNLTIKQEYCQTHSVPEETTFEFLSTALSGHLNKTADVNSRVKQAFFRIYVAVYRVDAFLGGRVSYW